MNGFEDKTTLISVFSAIEKYIKFYTYQRGFVLNGNLQNNTN